MKIALLLKREPFGQIFEKTLTHYLKFRFGEPVSVKWFPKLPGKISGDQQGYQFLYCNPYVDAIFSEKISVSTRREIRRRYGYSPKLWRRIAQNIYMYLAVHPFLMQLLASNVIAIFPAIEHVPDVLIRGGINRIRLFDYETGEVIVLLKSGLPERWMANEIDLRTKVRSVIPNIPEILHSNCKEGVFVESILDGQVVEQIGERDLYHSCMSEALDVLAHLNQKTLTTISIDEFLEERVNYISRRLASSPLLSKSIINKLQALVSTLCAVIRSQEISTDPIKIAITHGDPQDGNIIWDGSQIWWVDWEFTGYRCYMYDYLVMFLETRSQPGMGERLIRWVAQPESIPGGICSRKWLVPQSRESRLFLAFLFLLEEIVYYLHVDDNPLITVPDHAFNILPEEIEVFLQSFTKK